MKTLVSNEVCCGLELEYEGVSYGDTERAYVRGPVAGLLSFHEDGSLRPRGRNTEIIFNQPLAGPNVGIALSDVGYLIDTLPYEVTWRCGMHVHIDFRGLSFAQATKAIVIAAMLEPVLYAWDGGGRQENKFCQSITDSVATYLEGSILGGNLNLTKYASVNLSSLRVTGSMELRFASGTKDIDRMTRFINIGFAIRQATLAFVDGVAIVKSFAYAGSLEKWIETYMHPLVRDDLLAAAGRCTRGFSPAHWNAALTLSDEKYYTHNRIVA